MRAFIRVFLLCLVALCVAISADARSLSDKALVEAVRKTFDEQTMRRGLGELRLLKQAGFVYQSALTVPRSGVHHSSVQSWDQKAVLSGIVSADRTFAYFFGTYKDVVREAAKLEKLLPHVPEKILFPNDKALAQKNLETPQGRDILAKRLVVFLNNLVKYVAKDETGLRFLGAYFYGDYIERLYLASIMALAAYEGGTINSPCSIRIDLEGKLGKILEIFAKEKLIGDQLRTESRARVVKSLRELSAVCSTKQGVSIGYLQKIVRICQSERSRYIAPTR